MQVRDGPAAVRGDARRGNATGREAGKAAKGEPRVRRPAALPDSNPSRKEDSCFADSSLSRCFSWWRSPPAALAANVKIRVEGKTTTIFGAAQPTADRRQRAPGARRRQHGRRVLLRHDDVELRRLRQPDRQVPGVGAASGWVFKVNGVSPPVGADKVTLKDGDVVLWYYATFGPAGGPPTLELQRLPANCYVVQSVTDAGQAHALGQRHARGGREALQDEGRPRLHRQARRPRARDRARRRPLERPAVIRRALARSPSSSSSPAAVAPARRRGRRRSGSRATAAPSCSSTRRSTRGRR